jgi:coenzyme F420-0:L-glutamate ligase
LRDENTVKLIPIRFPTVKVGQRLAPIVISALEHEHVSLQRGDVVAVASKIVSTCEGRIINLEKTKVTAAARRLAKMYDIDERLTTVVLRESDEVFGGVKGFLLTLKTGILTPNAGVDVKNAPPGAAILWPKNPDLSARGLLRSLERHFQTHVGVEVVDSHVTPLRLGTTGLAIGVSGFAAVRDERSNLDLYGRTIKVTQTNVADDVAAAAHLLMGEAADRIGAVVARNARLTRASSDGRNAKMDVRKCLIGSSLVKNSWELLASNISVCSASTNLGG